LDELVEQANGMRDLGFHLNYMMLVIQVDGVARDLYNFASRRSTDERFRTIYHATWNTPIHDDVGVILVEISQPTALTFRDAGVVCVCIESPRSPTSAAFSLDGKDPSVDHREREPVKS